MVDPIEVLAIIFVLGIPSVALATHLVVRPLLRDVFGSKADKEKRSEIESRIEQLEDVVRDMDTQVHRLVEAERFRRELEAGTKERVRRDS